MKRFIIGLFVAFALLFAPAVASADRVSDTCNAVSYWNQSTLNAHVGQPAPDGLGGTMYPNPGTSWSYTAIDSYWSNGQPKRVICQVTNRFFISRPGLPRAKYLFMINAVWQQTPGGGMTSWTWPQWDVYAGVEG